MRPLVILLAALALLAGCGGDDDGGGSKPRGTTSTTAAAAGADVSGGGRFSVRLADGWSDRTGKADLGSIKPEVVLVGPRDGNFNANVNVIRERVPDGVGLDDAGKAFQQQVKGLGGRNVHEVEVPALGGEEAKAHEFDRTEGKTEIVQRQVYAIRDGNLYTVTFSATAAEAGKQRPAFEAMLASWRWK